MEKQPINRDRQKTQRFVAMLMWCFIVFMYVGVITQWFTVNRRDQVFRDYVTEVIQDGAREHRSATEVRALLLTKADDLTVPVHPESINVSGSGPTLRASVKYYADINMPLINQRIYRMNFTHNMIGR